MTRLAIVFMFMLGCGESGLNYDVRIGALDPARCKGYMQLVGDEGYWRCELIGGKATRDNSTTGVVFLNLETTPGFFSQVRGELGPGESITGQIFIDGDSVAFMAVPQPGQ